jgi:hypothetical protein
MYTQGIGEPAFTSEREYGGSLLEQVERWTFVGPSKRGRCIGPIASSRKRGLDAALFIWTMIRSFNKGLMEALLLRLDQVLPEEEYLGLGERDGVTCRPSSISAYDDMQCLSECYDKQVCMKAGALVVG